MPRGSLVAVLALAGLVSACDSSTKPTPANFTKAIDAYFAAHRECLTIPDRDHPLLYAGQTEDPRYIVDLRNTGPGGFGRDRLEQLDALVAAGLLARSNTTHSTAIFALTPVGASARASGDRQQAAEQALPAPSGLTAIFGPICYARRKDVSIDNYSLGSFGVRFAEVQYSYKLADKAAWAGNDALHHAFPNTAIDAAGPVKDHITLQLTAHGWSGDGK